MSSFLVNKICKLCLATTKTEDFIEILSERGVELNIESIIAQHFSSEINNTDSKNDFICLVCWNTIDNFHQLYERVEQNYKIDEVKIFAPEQYFVEAIVKEEKLEVLLNEECNNATEERHEHSLPNSKEKNELDTSNEDYDNEYSDYDDYSTDDDKKLMVLQTSQKRRKLKGTNKRKVPTVSETNLKKRKIKDTPKLKKQYKKKEKPLKKEKFVKPKKEILDKFDSAEHLHKIPKYFQMFCDLCMEPLDSIRLAKKHYRNVHNTVGYLKCCEKKFYRLHRIAQHCMLHENPNAFKCEICFKTFLDAIGLSDHTKTMHCPDDKKQYECDICSEFFLHKYRMINHFKKKHMQKDFNCDICGKGFIYECVLRKHKQQVHENINAFICEICAKGFKTKKGYNCHYTSTHISEENSGKSQCDVCGKWVTHVKEHRRRHAMERHECHICNRIFAIKSDLLAHLRYVHTEAKYACTICDKIFKKKQSLREHMGVHTGRSDLYKCTFCPRTFRAGSNMYGHRKRAHPELYEQLQNPKNNLNISSMEIA